MKYSTYYIREYGESFLPCTGIVSLPSHWNQTAKSNNVGGSGLYCWIRSHGLCWSHDELGLYCWDEVDPSMEQELGEEAPSKEEGEMGNPGKSRLSGCGVSREEVVEQASLLINSPSSVSFELRAAMFITALTASDSSKTPWSCLM